MWTGSKNYCLSRLLARPTLLVGLLLIMSSHSQAAPYLMSDPAPAGSGVDAARYTVDGGAPVTCILESVSGTVRPKCDLAQITTAGDYTLVLTWCSPGGITNDAGGGGATVVAAGCASSAPFVYRYRGPVAVGPIPSIAP